MRRSIPARRDLVMLACASLAACAPRPKPPQEVAPAVSADVPSSAAPLAPDGGASSTSSRRRAPAGDPSPMDGPCPAELAKTLSGVAPDPAWFDAHHIAETEAQSLYDCTAVSVGAPPRDALVCSEVLGESSAEDSRQSGGGMIFHLAVVVAGKTHLKRVLDVPFSAGPQDRMSCVDAHNYYVKLAVAPHADGLGITLGERPDFACAKLLQKDPQEDGDIDAPMRRLVAKVCHAKGEYVWRGGKFVRAGKP